MTSYQQTHASLHQLREFLQQYSSTQHKDQYWRSILQSDIRNIIPKHQVCKIQLLKNNLSKIRLIMENLNVFISLELHKKHLKEETLDLNEGAREEIRELLEEGRKKSKEGGESEKMKNEKGFQNNHYDVQTFALRKKQIQLLSKQLSKSKTSQQLKLLIKNNKKWSAYLQKHIKQLQKVTQSSIHEDILNLLQTYQGLFDFNFGVYSTNNNKGSPTLKKVQSSQNPQKYSHLRSHPQFIDQIILKSGSYTKLYQNKLRQKILIQKLVEQIFEQKQMFSLKNNVTNQQKQKQTESTTNNNDQYWKNQVKRIRQQHGI